jgi:hypothetical protein
VRAVQQHHRCNNEEGEVMSWVIGIGGILVVAGLFVLLVMEVMDR